MKSIVDAIVKSLSTNFDVKSESNDEYKNVKNNQILIVSKRYCVVLEKKEDAAKEDDKLEDDASDKQEDSKNDKVSMDTILDKGKRMVVKGVVQSVEDKYVAIKCGSIGRIELYLPIKGFEKGDKVTMAIKRI